ncbi:hypothetical protein Ga0466249_003179 [Sporomusaceae bacterium BoRhaA]|nr:hypothetical protein [Pelorhabdus rhamnosifermentans]MBU2702052.1 hypothetical protein [Pelorhabdus rhamnosifermentans]
MDNILLIAIGVSAAIYIIRLIVSQIKGESSCSCSKGCQGCRLKQKDQCK